MLDTKRPTIFDLGPIERDQPVSAMDAAIAWVNDLPRVDRHRVMIMEHDRIVYVVLAGTGTRVKFR
jgi:hypothetical protein